MRATTKRLLTWAISATSAVAITATTATGVEAGSRHVRKHHPRMMLGWSGPMRRAPADGMLQPVVDGRWTGPGEVCPGNARAIDCKIWPPPIYDDPDRKVSGNDGGG